jgi:hypothetical protein
VSAFRSIVLVRRATESTLCVVVGLIWSCSEGPRRTPGDSAQALSAQQVPTASRSVDAAPETCVTAARGRVRLTGVLREEHRLGPPGYGETPRQDQKITILVLQLPNAIDVCADTSTDDPRPAVRAIRELQITGRLDPSRLRVSSGREITVYGSLYRQAWGTDYTQVLIRVDSIPGVYAAPRPRA